MGSRYRAPRHPRLATASWGAAYVLGVTLAGASAAWLVAVVFGWQGPA